jgi:para-aminobenzoate synthetase/4-amino-4-deoxychorismate lyase
MGSVKVARLYDVERYRTVHQLTSTITATLRADVTLPDVFAALFPCGSVTGAPKISTMQIITELERSARGVYCGALGVIAPGGHATFNVPIRTAVIDRRSQRASYGTGAGITYDSDAAAEFAEIAAKTAVLVESWPEFELLETMRFENGKFVRLERHVARLMDSARYFGFAVKEAIVRAHLSGIRSNAARRIRLLVNARGHVRSEVLPLNDAGEISAMLAAIAVSSTDRFLFHKTTNRQVYESRMLPECDDVLLWNERDEVTEFTRGNVVVEMDGHLITPPRDCGLLAGTFRAELLEQNAIHERVIHLDDLAHAERIFLINSVREWLSVTLALPKSLPTASSQDPRSV